MPLIWISEWRAPGGEGTLDEMDCLKTRGEGGGYQWEWPRLISFCIFCLFLDSNSLYNQSNQVVQLDYVCSSSDVLVHQDAG